MAKSKVGKALAALHHQAYQGRIKHYKKAMKEGRITKSEFGGFKDASRKILVKSRARERKG